MRNAVILGILVSTLGCVTFTPAPSWRGDLSAPVLAPSPQPNWPRRFTEPLVFISRRAVPDPIAGSGYSTLDSFLDMTVGKAESALPKTPWRHRFRGVFGQGAICEVTADPEEEQPAPERAGPQTSRFTFACSRTDLEGFWRARDAAVESADPIEAFKNFPINSMQFELLEPAGREAQGLVIAISSWGGQPREIPVREELLDRGWAVLMTHPPFQSRMRKEFEIRRRDDVLRVAHEAAQVVNERIADAAYGVEAVLDFLKQSRPDLPQDRVFVVGFSAGAIVAPAVALRIAGRVDGLVLVGGGADLLTAALKSEFEGQPIRVRGDPGVLSDTAVEGLDFFYLEKAFLDPYNAAHALGGKPTLLLLARSDRIFQAESGRLLYKRLGRPDLYSFPFGHLWLFWRLPAYRKVIVDWIERAADPEAHGGSRREP